MISTTTGLQTPEFQKSIHFNGEIRDIVDWPHTGILGLNNEEGGETDGFVFTDYNVVTNAFHYEVLKQMADIGKVIGELEEADFINNKQKCLRNDITDFSLIREEVFIGMVFQRSMLLYMGICFH